jgi:hypothetical protein
MQPTTITIDPPGGESIAGIQGYGADGVIMTRVGRDAGGAQYVGPIVSVNPNSENITVLGRVPKGTIAHRTTGSQQSRKTASLYRQQLPLAGNEGSATSAADLLDGALTVVMSVTRSTSAPPGAVLALLQGFRASLTDALLDSLAKAEES